MHVRLLGQRMGYSVHAGGKLSGEIEVEMSWQDTESCIRRVEYRKWHEILIYSNIGGGCYNDKCWLKNGRGTNVRHFRGS